MKRRDFWKALGLGALALTGRDAKAVQVPRIVMGDTALATGHVEPSSATLAEVLGMGNKTPGKDITITAQGCNGGAVVTTSLEETVGKEKRLIEYDIQTVPQEKLERLIDDLKGYGLMH